jgi:hypothetical protein
MYFFGLCPTNVLLGPDAQSAVDHFCFDYFQQILVCLDLYPVFGSFCKVYVHACGSAYLVKIAHRAYFFLDIAVTLNLSKTKIAYTAAQG